MPETKPNLTLAAAKDAAKAAIVANAAKVKVEKQADGTYTVTIG
jgi:hypothetical protein